jgi:hypothetical protein
MRRLLILAGFPLLGCDAPPVLDAGPQGVRIFAEDTVVARINIRVEGDLRINLRGDNFMIRRDRSFLVSTPATLEVVRGTGTATIVSMDTTTRIAVVPIGTPDDSLDAATITGTVVSFTRPGSERRTHRLISERP